MVRGEGLDGKGDGLCFKNTLATYSHIHALGTPAWAEAMIQVSMSFQEKRLKA
jgi:cobyrinic acid a,c-diamide synthase